MPFPYKTTVTVPADSHDLTTLEVVKDELEITSDVDDATLARMISQQSAVAERYCNRTFPEETFIDTFSLQCVTWQPLITSCWPIISITSVTEVGSVLASTDYEFSDSEIWKLDISGNPTSWKVGRIEIVFVAGYDIIPGDVERAVLVLIRQAWFAKSRDPLASAESVEGVGSTSYKVGSGLDGEALPAEATSLLKPYIRYPA